MTRHIFYPYSETYMLYRYTVTIYTSSVFQKLLIQYIALALRPADVS